MKQFYILGKGLEITSAIQIRMAGFRVAVVQNSKPERTVECETPQNLT